MEGRANKQGNTQEMESRLKEEKAKAEYYQRIAHQTGRKRLMEVENLSRLINDLRKAEADRREGERFLINIIESIQDGISVLDTGMTIVRTNSTMERWYAHAMPLVGKKCYEAYHGRNKPCDICPTYRTLQNAEKGFEVIPKRGSGGDVAGWLELFSYPLFDVSTGQLKGVIEYVRDITEKKRAEETIIHMAYHDVLTGLPNRVLFNDRLAVEIARAMREIKQVAVIVMDLDRFKDVNDAHGHSLGDVLLKDVAGRLSRLVRRSDTVARMGGDEFLIALPGMNVREDVIRIVGKIMASFQDPFQLESSTLNVTASIGIALYPDDGGDVETLVKHADAAMYQAKAAGRNTYKYYS